MAVKTPEVTGLFAALPGSMASTASDHRGSIEGMWLARMAMSSVAAEMSTWATSAEVKIAWWGDQAIDTRQTTGGRHEPILSVTSVWSWRPNGTNFGARRAAEERDWREEGRVTSLELQKFLSPKVGHYQFRFPTVARPADSENKNHRCIASPQISSEGMSLNLLTLRLARQTNINHLQTFPRHQPQHRFQHQPLLMCRRCRHL